MKPAVKLVLVSASLYLFWKWFFEMQDYESGSYFAGLGVQPELPTPPRSALFAVALLIPGVPPL